MKVVVVFWTIVGVRRSKIISTDDITLQIRPLPQVLIFNLNNMKVKLLRKCRNGTRIVKFPGEYAIQTWTYDSGWFTVKSGTLAEMLALRHQWMKEFIRQHTEYLDLKVVC